MTRELRPEINPATGKMMIAIYIDGTHSGYCDSYKAADELCNEIEAKRAARDAYRAAQSAATCATCLDTGWESGDPCSADCPATVVVAAYIAPRPTPRKAKVKKSTCGCPRCFGPCLDEDGVSYCRKDREHVAYHNGLFIKAGEYMTVLTALGNHRYNLLTKGNASPADLDAEQAADVLAAAALDATTI